jgi:Flp pilus assembly protein TadD
MRLRIALVLPLVLAGCTSFVRPRSIESAALLAQVRSAGFTVEDPVELDAQAQAEVRAAIGFEGAPRERLRRLTRWLTDRGGLDFQSASNTTFSASKAFRARAGDCMAFANLYAGAARVLGVETFFVHVSEAPTYFERDGAFFFSSHIAVGIQDGSTMSVIDLANVQSDWKLALYRPISDRAALALYLSNLAVEQMLGGDADGAARLLALLLEAERDLPELYSNLGVALMRSGHHAQAYEVLHRGVERFPSYRPLYTNGVQAARSAGLLAEADVLEERGSQVASTDPYFLFGQGLSLYQHANYRDAAIKFERAASSQPKNVVIQAWRARAYFSAGEEHAALEALEQLREIAPDHPLVQELERMVTRRSL